MIAHAFFNTHHRNLIRSNTFLVFSFLSSHSSPSIWFGFLIAPSHSLNLLVNSIFLFRVSVACWHCRHQNNSRRRRRGIEIVLIRHCLLRPHRSNGNHFRKMNYIPLAPFQVPMCTNCQLFDACMRYCVYVRVVYLNLNALKTLSLAFHFNGPQTKMKMKKVRSSFTFSTSAACYTRVRPMDATFSFVKMKPKKGEAGMEAMEV